jgi:hypothetical protein
MSTNYDLTPDAQREIAEAQVEQFKRERYGHKLNIARLDAQAQTDEVTQAKAEAEQAIIIIEAAIDATLAAVEGG